MKKILPEGALAFCCETNGFLCESVRAQQQCTYVDQLEAERRWSSSKRMDVDFSLAEERIGKDHIVIIHFEGTSV